MACLSVVFTAAGLNAAEAQLPAPPPAVEYRVPTDPNELLTIDDTMRRFFRDRIRIHYDEADQLHALVDAIFRPTGLNFCYDPEWTFDARGAFYRRRGNCVSVAFLVVAVAREFGFDASFQNVAAGTRWSRFGELVVSVQHMNVRVVSDGKVYVIDPRPDLVSGVDLSEMDLIRDRRAFAELYSNVGFFELFRGQQASALEYLTLATATDPSCATAWANRATLHARLNDLQSARTCFERSIRADPRGMTAIDGYVGVLQRLGTPEDLQLAAKYARRAQAIRDRNPYYQQHLAAKALERGDKATAEKLLRRAIALKNDEPEFYEQWIRVLEQLGLDDEARRAGAKLEKLRKRLGVTLAEASP